MENGLVNEGEYFSSITIAENIVTILFSIHED